MSAWSWRPGSRSRRRTAVRASTSSGWTSAAGPAPGGSCCPGGRSKRPRTEGSAYPPPCPRPCARSSRGLRAEQLPPALLAAQLEAESGFDAAARSPSGAQGIAQFMPSTWSGAWNPQRERSPFEPGPAVAAQARLMHALLERADGDIATALGAYNAGPSVLPIDWTRETRSYVARILRRFGPMALGAVSLPPERRRGRAPPALSGPAWVTAPPGLRCVRSGSSDQHARSGNWNPQAGVEAHRRDRAGDSPGAPGSPILRAAPGRAPTPVRHSALSLPVRAVPCLRCPTTSVLADPREPRRCRERGQACRRIDVAYRPIPGDRPRYKRTGGVAFGPRPLRNLTRLL